MSVKILTSTVIGLDAFCQDPVNALATVNEGALAVFNNNMPVLYAVTPERLAQLLALEESARLPPSDVTLEQPFYQDALPPQTAIATPLGKFAMYRGWRPDKDFLRQAAIWGVALTAPITTAELASFVDYWQAEGRLYHHVQWQQKLARSVQQGRMGLGGKLRPDVNQLPEPDQSIPDGFRG